MKHDELVYLRDLAKKQKEISELPIMQARKAMWTAMNDGGVNSRPPFVLENGTFKRDFMPDTIYRCEDPLAVKIEYNLLQNIRRHELLNDDHVCPGEYTLGWEIEFDEFGIEIPTEWVKDAEGITTGYHFDCPIKDLETDSFEMLKPSSFSVDKVKTYRKVEQFQEVLDGILEVKIEGDHYLKGNLTQRLMRLMSMETFFMGMYTAPERVHEIMRYLLNNAKTYSLWAEQEGILTLNNRNQCTCGSCFNYTNQLPPANYDANHVKLKDLWGVMDSQETVGVSPEFFAEFCLPYYQEFGEMFGRIYWGCCEPVDPVWDSLAQLTNLGAVSISKWANQELMGEILSGKGIVYSRKPDPNFLSVDPVLDEAGWAEELETSVKIMQKNNIPGELIVRDVYTLHGDVGNARRAVEIARGILDREYGAL